jgi:lipoprotein-releasing system permease protein
VINIISGISVLGVTVGTAALVVLLSAFNGLESWVINLYDAFDSDVKIEHRNEKFFQLTDDKMERLSAIDGVKYTMPVIEENGLLTYGDARFICTVKGVGTAFEKMSGIDSMMVEGRFSLGSDSSSNAILGSGVAYSLSLSLQSLSVPLEVYVPRPGATYTLNPAEAFSAGTLRPTGIFQIQPEVDTRYVIVPFAFAESLFDRRNKMSSIEIQLGKSANSKQALAEISSILGPEFLVKDRFEQHDLLYKIINAEKWAVYLILTFILIIAVFNITGSLTMLIVDKSKDIRTLESLGADQSMLRKIFFTEGMLITFFGLLLGISSGLAIVWLQDKFSLVMISQFDAYPVLLKGTDILLIAITVILIGAVAAWFPANSILKRYRLNFGDK